MMSQGVQDRSSLLQEGSQGGSGGQIDRYMANISARDEK